MADPLVVLAVYRLRPTSKFHVLHEVSDDIFRRISRFAFSSLPWERRFPVGSEVDAIDRRHNSRTRGRWKVCAVSQYVGEWARVSRNRCVGFWVHVTDLEPKHTHTASLRENVDVGMYCDVLLKRYGWTKCVVVKITNSGLRPHILVCASIGCGEGSGKVIWRHFVWVTDVGDDRFVMFGGQELGLNVLRWMDDDDTVALEKNLKLARNLRKKYAREKCIEPSHIQPGPPIMLTADAPLTG